MELFKVIAWIQNIYTQFIYSIIIVLETDMPNNVYTFLCVTY